MEVIKFQGIGTDDLDIEGAIEGVGNQYIDGPSATFKIESESEDKVIEIRAQKDPYWVFSLGPYDGDFLRKPLWRHSRQIQTSPIINEVLQIEVPDDSVIERIN